MAVQKQVEKWKSKRWFNIFAPKIFGESVISEIPGADEKSMLGRVIKVNMSWITHKPEHSFITVSMKIDDVNGDAAHTQLMQLEQTYSYIHSLVRRRQSAIYTVDAAKDKNGKDMIIKLLVMTTDKIATPKKTAIRRTISNFVKEYSASHDVDEIVNGLISNSFQQEAAGKILNIAEISKLELKKIEL